MRRAPAGRRGHPAATQRPPTRPTPGRLPGRSIFGTVSRPLIKKPRPGAEPAHEPHGGGARWDAGSLFLHMLLPGQAGSAAHAGASSAAPQRTAPRRGPCSFPPLRVVHFTDSLEPSGVGEHIYLLARELCALAHTQALVCPDVPATRRLRERCAALGVTISSLCVRHADDKADFAQLVRLLRHGGYDLCHVHAGITWEGCWGVLAARQAGVPVVCTEHLPYLITNPRERTLKLQASRHMSYIIAVSQGVGRSLAEHLLVPRQALVEEVRGASDSPAAVSDTLLSADELVRYDRLRVVWNGIDVARYSPVRWRALRRSLLALDLDQQLVICIGRMTPQKGHALLLDAVARARREAPHLTLVMAGDGPLRETLQAHARHLGLGEAVRFLGNYPHVPQLLSCADIQVQPSSFEGLPLAVLEGMASALPVVVTNSIGSNETVISGESGLVVPPDDPASLAQALLRLVRDQRAATQLGVRARRRVEREFTARLMAQRTQTVYYDAVHAFAGSA